MNRPSFLVIGAMKSGTTTLYEDLRSQPGLLVSDKESGILTGQQEGPNNAPSDDQILRSYDAAFGPARPETLCGEVATTYSMEPHFPGVAQRAARLFPSSLKIVYLVRNPITRIISHHHHDYSSGRLGSDVDTAVRSDPRMLDYSRYATQIHPWIEAFGPDRVLLVRFESYVADRDLVLQDILRFLGAPGPLQPVGAEVHNASTGKRVATGMWGKIARSPIYRRAIRPIIPQGFKRRAMTRVLPQAPDRPTPPAVSTLDYMRQELEDDMAAFSRLIGEDWWGATPPTRGTHTPLGLT